MTKEERKEYSKLYYQNNKEKIKEQVKEYRENNKDKIKEYYKEYRETNKDKIKEYIEKNKDKIKYQVKIYQEKNKDKIKEYSKIYKKVYIKERRKNDLLFKFKGNIRTMINNSFTIKNNKKLSKTELILGCSFEEFKNHLESKFESWMSWNNYGKYNRELNYGWDIDHIIPTSYAKTEEEIIKLNHYTNLQPLCSKINRDIKKDKLDFII